MNNSLMTEIIKQTRPEFGLVELFEGRMVKSTEVEYSSSNQVDYLSDQSKFVKELTAKEDQYTTYVKKIEKRRAEELLAKSDIAVQNLVTDEREKNEL